MVRAFLGLYQSERQACFSPAGATHRGSRQRDAGQETGIYRDPEKWAHLMVEADLELYRTTREPYLLERARRHADAYYGRWKEKGPVDLITVSSISRVLWLMADTETEAGRSFWKKEDAFKPGFAPAGLR